jgi:hypothetical protein
MVNFRIRQRSLCRHAAPIRPGAHKNRHNQRRIKSGWCGYWLYQFLKSYFNEYEHLNRRKVMTGRKLLPSPESAIASLKLPELAARTRSLPFPKRAAVKSRCLQAMTWTREGAQLAESGEGGEFADIVCPEDNIAKKSLGKLYEDTAESLFWHKRHGGCGNDRRADNLHGECSR